MGTWLTPGACNVFLSTERKERVEMRIALEGNGRRCGNNESFTPACNAVTYIDTLFVFAVLTLVKDIGDASCAEGHGAQVFWYFN